jgi:hypothetical protein
MLMLSVPLIDYFVSAIGRMVDFFQDGNSSTSDVECSQYFFKSWYKWIEQIASVATGLIINTFMLRNMSVAAILRAETLEEEIHVRRRLKVLTAFYLPTYFCFQITIYSCEISIFNSIYKGIQLPSWLLPTYLTINIVKLMFSATLGITTFCFA